MKRWMIIAEDGRHATLGEHRSPSEEEIDQVTASLSAHGLGGWLVLGDGDYYQPRTPFDLEKVRQVSDSQVSWEVAETRFRDLRSRSCSPAG
ncbi:hypothetical protein QMA67_12170 [Gluconobacter japonicus]|uniref:hypothetical protein n=1 Tax=Gluconobacter japonicus TaxID=376620 RepID=UPI00094FEB17|nr:hypothetical protein [Gluconobacter japonicus]MDI6653686.1 hypothetical protein [Gluconobacter japonicus]